MRPGPCLQGAHSLDGVGDTDIHRMTYYSMVQVRAEVSAGPYQSQKPNIVLCIHSYVCMGRGGYRKGFTEVLTFELSFKRGVLQIAKGHRSWSYSLLAP